MDNREIRVPGERKCKQTYFDGEYSSLAELLEEVAEWLNENDKQIYNVLDVTITLGDHLAVAVYYT